MRSERSKGLLKPKSDESLLIKQLEDVLLVHDKEDWPFLMRAKIALAVLKGETNLTLRYGPFKQTNTPNKDLLCDYPDGSTYNKERAKCGNPIKRCMGREYFMLSVSKGADDIEHCEEHLKKDYGKELPP